MSFLKYWKVEMFLLYSQPRIEGKFFSLSFSRLISTTWLWIPRCAPRPHPYTHHKCKFVEAVFMECSCPPIIFTVIKHLYHGRVQGLRLVKVTYFHLKGYNTFVPHIQTSGDILGMVQELPAFCPKSIIDYRKRRKCCTASPKAKGGPFLQTFRYLHCEYGGE